MVDELISKTQLLEALTKKWDDRYSEVVDFIKEFPYESIVIKKGVNKCK